MAPMIEVQSSMLSHIGYSPADRVLNIRFRNSAFVHPMLDVPAETHAALMAAPSIGKAYNELIRGKFTPGSPIAVDEPIGAEAEAVDASA